jgi:uncharacterized protein with HEPN domain
MKHEYAFLRHILDETDFLIEKTSGVTFEAFMHDEVLKRACARSLEIIGEAVKNIPDKFRSKHKAVEWKKIAGMRDKIVHYYFGVNWDILWDVIETKIPGLRKQIKELLKEAEKLEK